MMHSGLPAPARAGRELVLSILLLALAACGSKDVAQVIPPAPVGVVEVAPAEVPIRVEYVGETAGFRDVEVRARVSGILLKQTYTEGQPVEAGQVLFEIDPEPYKAALDQARGGLAQAQAVLNKAKSDRERVVPLYERGVVSRRDYDETVAAHESALANVQTARARVREAELNLDYTRVTAPISGVASRVAQSEGSLVSAGASSGLLTTISQFDPLYVNFSYSEQDRLSLERMLREGSLKLADDQPLQARIRLSDGSLYEAPGRVNFSDNRVDSRTGTIRARAIFDNPDGALLPGQFVRVILELGTIGGLLQVPERAIAQSQSERLVMVVGTDNVVAPRPVKLGYASDGKVVVTAGLAPGDRVVVDGLIKARPGSKVAPTVIGAAGGDAPAAGAPAAAR
jgi:membrane fusion protein (multidrug efflux system)